MRKKRQSLITTLPGEYMLNRRKGAPTVQTSYVLSRFCDQKVQRKMMDLESVSEGDGSEVPLNNQHLNRGGIKVFGLRSRLASDDFVLPAWIAFLTRVIYLTTTLGSIHI